MIRKEILERVLRLVTQDREGTHGNPSALFADISRYWNIYLHGRNGPISESDVAMLNLLQKVARTQHGSFNEDDYIDMAGYASLAAELETLE